METRKTWRSGYTADWHMPGWLPFCAGVGVTLLAVALLAACYVFFAPHDTPLYKHGPWIAWEVFALGIFISGLVGWLVWARARNVVSLRGADESIIEVFRYGEAPLKSSPRIRSEMRMRMQADDQLPVLLMSANCLLWYAIVEQDGEDAYRWHIHTANVEAAEKFMPVHREPGQTYTDGWIFSKLPEDWVRADLVSSKAFREGETRYNLEYRCRRDDGSIMWLAEDVHLEPIDEGRWYLVGITTDITERKGAEEQLRKLSLAVEQSPTSVIITDTHGGIEYVNPAFTRMTGYTSDEVMGRNVDLLRADAVKPEVFAQLWDSISSGKEWRGQYEARSKDGKSLVIAATVSPIQDNDGRVTHYATVQEDVTEREELQDQLQQVQKMEGIGRLAGGVAHDFNNILTVIQGFAAMVLNKTAEDDPLHKDVEEIVRASERGANLTRQLLAFARKPTGVAQPVSIDTAVTAIEGFLRRILGEDVQLITELAAPTSAFEAEPGQIDQVIMNLAVNARDAMPEGGKLVIRTTVVDLDAAACAKRSDLAPGEYVLLSVRDTGCGMSEEVRKHAFEPFYTTKEVGKGTGLGLSTVYGIAKQYGGDIEILSEVNVGTEFRMYFPKIEKQVEERDVPKATSTPHGRETILIVEDDDAVRLLMSTVLQGLGYKVIEASGGADAVKLYRRHRKQIDLLLTDVVMPEMGGPEVAERLKGWNRDLKVVYASGFTEHPVVYENVTKKGESFIQKPFSRTQLGQIVRNTLDKN